MNAFADRRHGKHVAGWMRGMVGLCVAICLGGGALQPIDAVLADEGAEGQARFASSRQAGDWARRSPFTEVQVNENRVRVRFDGEMYQLVSIEGIATKEILNASRRQFGDLWEKRFVEDLVEVLEGLGRDVGKTVALELARADGEVITIENAPVTEANRRAIYLARHRRAREENSREPAEFAEVRELVARFADAAKRNDRDAMQAMLDPERGTRRTDNYLESARRLMDAGVELANVKFTIAKQDRGMAVTGFYQAGELLESDEARCVVYYCVRRDGTWLVRDVDFDDVEEYSRNLLAFVHSLRDQDEE